MIRLIWTDIRRVLLKTGFYILPALLFLITVTVLKKGNRGFEDIYTDNQFTYRFVAAYIAAIPVFMAVYADELKSGAWVVAIGRGMSRRKIVVSKFLDGVILTVFMYVFFFALDLITMAYYMVTPTPLQMERAILLNLSYCLKNISYMGFASIFVYITWSASVGMIVEVIMISFTEMALGWVQDQLRIPLLDISMIGQIDQAFANYAAGKNWIVPAIAVIAYIVAFILISMEVFNRKELEL
ncbi:MAG: hypothetical protein J6O70_07705 [Lachnospiraceae bacterium]|nr:hypothetical protein [Lachnospiraceae bacterium]